MKITKIGHSCLLIEENHLRILIDPGAYSTGQTELREIDLVLITHEHPDHVDLASLDQIIKNNPGVKIVTNRGVAKILRRRGTDNDVLAPGKNIIWQNVMVESVG